MINLSYIHTYRDIINLLEGQRFQLPLLYVYIYIYVHTQSYDEIGEKGVRTFNDIVKCDENFLYRFEIS